MNLKSNLKAAFVLACLLASLACARAASAAETIKVQKVSTRYDLEVLMDECVGRDYNENACNSPASVRVFRKGSKKPFQVLRLPNVELYKDTAAYSPETSEKPRGIYAEEYTFVFDDFNFDGREDLAVCNGRNGGYGGPSYNVFLFDRRAGRFIEGRALSRLTEGVYLGLFFPDAKKKTLAAFSKSGCCYHETEVYKVVNNRPVLVEKVIEDARVGEGYVLVTTRKRVGRRWVVTKKREKLEEN